MGMDLVFEKFINGTLCSCLNKIKMESSLSKYIYLSIQKLCLKSNDYY